MFTIGGYPNQYIHNEVRVVLSPEENTNDYLHSFGLSVWDSFMDHRAQWNTL